MNNKSLKERFESKYIPEPNSGCWIWTDQCHYSGYGHFRLKNKTIRAHRMSWMIYKGEIPSNLIVCHKCDIKCCVNPDHLFLGSFKDNMVDKVNKKRHFFRKDFCKHGHKLDEKNIYSFTNKYGYSRRECKECMRIAARESRKRNKNRKSSTV
jgi:hypothetical protein